MLIWRLCYFLRVASYPRVVVHSGSFPKPINNGVINKKKKIVRVCDCGNEFYVHNEQEKNRVRGHADKNQWFNCDDICNTCIYLLYEETYKQKPTQKQTRRKANLTKEEVKILLTNNETFMDHVDGPVFIGSHYKGIVLPSWMALLRLENMKDFFSSIVNVEHPQRIGSSFRDIQREASLLLHNNLELGPWCIAVRDFLVTHLLHFYIEDEIPCEMEHPLGFPTPAYRLQFPLLSQDLFFGERQIVAPGALLNSFGEVVLKYFKRSKSLTEQRIKSICESLIASGLEDRDIYCYFATKCPAFDAGFIHDTLGIPGHMSYNLWFVPFMRGDEFYYEIDDYRAFYKDLHSRSVEMRKRVLKFVVDYVTLGRLSLAERNEILSLRSEVFADIMRGPSCQALFACGFTSDEVIAHVWNKHNEELCSINANNGIVSKKKRMTVKNRERLRAKARDYKVETHSGKPVAYEGYFTDVGDAKRAAVLAKAMDRQQRVLSQTRWYTPDDADVFDVDRSDQRYGGENVTRNKSVLDGINFAASPPTRFERIYATIDKWKLWFGHKCADTFVWCTTKPTEYLSGRITEHVAHAAATTVRTQVWSIFKLMSLGALLTFTWTASPLLAVVTGFLFYACQDVVGYAEGLIWNLQSVEFYFNFWRRLITPGAEILTPDTKLLLLDAKNVAHILHYTYTGDYDHIPARVADFLITRPEMIRDAIGKISWPDWHAQMKSEGDEVTIDMDGGPMRINKRDYVAAAASHRNSFYDSTFLTGNNVLKPVDEITIESDKANTASVLKTIALAVKACGFFPMSEHDTKVMCMNFTLTDHIGRSANAAWDSFTTVISVLGKTFYGYDPFDVAYKKFSTEVLGFIDLVDQMVMYTPTQKIDIEICEKVCMTRTIGTMLRKDMYFVSLPGHIQRWYQTRFLQLETLAQEADVVLSKSRSRLEPTFVFMTGPPEVGKTALSQLLENGICTLMGETYNPNMTFSYNPTTPFWEGYKEQRFVQMDDMFKSDDTDIRMQEATSVIDMVNTKEFNLNMAFADKGRVRFKSDFVFGSTNIANRGLKYASLQLGLTDNQAFIRRCHIVLHRTDKLDVPVKFAKFVVHKCDLLPEYVGKSLTGRQIVFLVYKHREAQRQRQQDYAIPQAELKELFKLSDMYLLDSDARMLESDGVIDLDEQSEALNLDQEADLEGDFHDVVNVQASPDDAGPMRFITLYLSLLRKEFAELTPQTYVFIGLFIVLITLATLGPLFMYMYSVESESVGSAVSSTREQHGTGHSRSHKVTHQKTSWTRVGKYNPNHSVHRGNPVSAHSLVDEFSCVTPQASSDQFDLQIYRQVMKGTMRIWVSALINGKERTESGVAHMLKDHIMCTVAHVFERYQGCDNVEVTLLTGGVTHVFFLHEVNHIKVDNLDLVFVELPNSIPRVASVYKYLTDELPEMPKGFPMVLMTTDRMGQPFPKYANKHDCERTNVTYSPAVETFLIEEPLFYWTTSIPGDSGAMVLIQGKQGRPNIIGLHVGSYITTLHSFGLSLQLTKSMVDYYISCLKPSIVVESSIGDRFPHEVCRRVDTSKKHVPARASKICRSPLYGYRGPPTRIPAILHSFYNEDGVLVDPLYIGLSKMSQTKFPAFDVPEHTMEYLERLYPSPGVGHLLDWDAAINGIIGTGMIAINYGTSPGYPYSLASKKGKGPYITRDDLDRLQYDPAVLLDVQTKDQLLRDGGHFEVLFADVLKDERRSIEKVRLGKTRIISTTPLDYLVLVRRYFLEFVAFVQERADIRPVAVGINASSPQWTTLYKRLLSKAQSTIAGDFSNYDGKIPQSLGRAFGEFVNNWYNDGPINARVRMKLLEYIFNAEHIIYDMVYQVHDGNPSGNPITSIYNSFCNIIMTHMILSEEFGIGDDEFEMVVYGDDNVITVARPGMRCSDLAPHFLAKFGMVYTHFSKTESDRHDTLATVRFLGRAFDDSGVFVKGPHHIETLYEALYWFKGDVNDEMVILGNCQTFFHELAHFDRLTFIHETKILLDAIRKRMPKLYSAAVEKCMTYAHYQKQMYEKPGGAYIKFATQSGDSNFFEVPIPNKVFDQTAEDIAGRDAVEPQPTQEFVLGDARDTNPVEHTSANSSIMQNIHVTNMDQKNMSGELARAYQVTSFDWTTAMGAETMLAHLDFPKLLFDIPYIAGKIADYRYFRGGVRLTMRVSSNPYLYGTVLVVYDPCSHENQRPAPLLKLLSGSGSQHRRLDASSAMNVAFDVPFVSTGRALDLSNHFANEIGTFRLLVEHPLVNILGTPSSAKVTVMAEFLDPHVFLPQSDTEGNFPKPTFVGVREYESHEFLNSQAPLYNVPDHNPIKRRDLSNIQSKPSSNLLGSGQVVTHSFIGEERFRSMHDTMANVATATRSIAGEIAKGVFKATTGFSFNRVPQPVRQMVGLSKPTSTSLVSGVVLNPAPDISSGKGLSNTVKIAMDPENGVSIDPMVAGGQDIDEMDLLTIAMRPMIDNLGSINLSDPATLVADCFASSKATPVWVDLISRHFKYYSGSYKFMFYFFSSQMHNVDLILYLQNVTGSGNHEDCYSVRVSVKGSVAVPITVPYCGQDIMEDGSGFAKLGIWFKILNWSVPDNTKYCPIYLTVYKAAADDFQFAGQKEYEFVAQSDPFGDFEKPFPPLHSGMSAYEHRGVVMGEQVRSLREMLHRFYFYKVGNNFNVWETPILATGTVYQGLEMFGLMFRFWRGSIRVKSITKNPAPPISILYIAGGNHTFVGSSLNGVTSPIIDAEVPYYRKEAIQSTSTIPAAADQYTVWSDTKNDRYYGKAAGDDFSFCWLTYPIAGTMVQPTSRGTVGFRAWLNV